MKKGGGARKGEVVQSKSPAEFFAENQNIAGFDNPGKSLYTTIREFVENSLDAAESIGVLPDVSLVVEEYTEAQFNEVRGMDNRDVVDEGLFRSKSGLKRPKSASKMAPPAAPAAPSTQPEDSDTNGTSAPAGVEVAGNIKSNAANGSSSASADGEHGRGGEPPPAPAGATPAKEAKKGRGKGEVFYYRVTCKDNGAGMPHEKIPDMLGRVLSSSKYGVRQTRGKFGLGAKMALIWSKKSTGLPIEVRSGFSTNPEKSPDFFTKCVLDIDIYHNCPSVHEHVQLDNPEGWRGTEITACVGGSWQTYKSRVLQYLQQLAIITPYAQLGLEYRCMSNHTKDLTALYRRRSDRMPPLAREVKHHPSSVNNLLVQQLLDRTKCKTLVQFLVHELACVERPLALRIVAELGKGFDPKMACSSLDTTMVNRLTQMLRDVSLFKAPDGLCLSPAGEYNLRLGIIKELEPQYVATYSEKPAVFEGHPFIVEAGVSLGGDGVKDGVNVYRFANRIPLLFEAGGDVVSRVAANRINWSSYKVDHVRDKIGVFVSIVSTKIPFKGTGKEYIGDDIEEIRKAVKHALQMCCQQLRVHLLKRNALREQRERKKVLVKYIPDVSRAIFGVLSAMRKRALEGAHVGPGANKRARGEAGAPSGSRADQGTFMRNGGAAAAKERAMAAMAGSKLTERHLAESLLEAVEKHDADAILEEKSTVGRGNHTRMCISLSSLEQHGQDADSMLEPAILHPSGTFKFSLLRGTLARPD